MGRYLIVALLFLATVVLAACGGGVSDEEFEAEQATVADLKRQLAEAEATPAPLTVVEANIAALNAGDVRGVVATYTDDTVFSFGPLPGGAFDTNTGLAEVLEDDLRSIGNNQQITLSNTSVNGNTVRGEFSLTDDESNQLGLSFSGTFEAVVEAGKIKSLTVTLSEESQALLQEQFGPPPGPPPQPGEVVFTAFDTEEGWGFRGPDSLPAGWTPVRLTNESSDVHHLQLIKLPEGMSLEDLFAAFEQPGPPPPGVEFFGGPGTVLPGGDSLATVNLEPGSYVMVCFIPDDEGVPHVAKGMVKPIIVTAATDTSAAEPQAVATVDVSDSGFTISGSIPAGVQTIRVTNTGQQHHDANLLQLSPGASGQDFLAAIAGPGGGGPFPGKLQGGVQAIEPGAQAYFTAVFEAGSYAILGFESGMTQDFTVQ